MLHALKNGLVLVLVGLLIIFAVQNAASVEVEFLLWSVHLPRAVVYVVIFAMGAMAGWLTRYFKAPAR